MLPFVLRGLMPGQLRGENSKSQGVEAGTGCPEPPKHGVPGVRAGARRAARPALGRAPRVRRCAPPARPLRCAPAATRESPRTENGTAAGTAPAEASPAPAGSQSTASSFFFAGFDVGFFGGVRVFLAVTVRAMRVYGAMR